MTIEEQVKEKLIKALEAHPTLDMDLLMSCWYQIEKDCASARDITRAANKVLMLLGEEAEMEVGYETVNAFVIACALKLACMKALTNGVGFSDKQILALSCAGELLANCISPAAIREEGNA